MTMPEKNTLTLSIKDRNCLHAFFPLLQKGFYITATMPLTIGDLLSDYCTAPIESLLARIQTIFLNGKPVDAPTTTQLNSGDCLALSAAMPGLVGATMRSGGLLAGFRHGISYRENHGQSSSAEEGRLCIKLFNLLIKEIGPDFLDKGIILTADDTAALLDDLRRSCPQEPVSAEWNETSINNQQLSETKWLLKSERPVFLRVHFG